VYANTRTGQGGNQALLCRPGEPAKTPVRFRLDVESEWLVPGLMVVCGPDPGGVNGPWHTYTHLVCVKKSRPLHSARPKDRPKNTSKRGISREEVGMCARLDARQEAPTTQCRAHSAERKDCHRVINRVINSFGAFFSILSKNWSKANNFSLQNRESSSNFAVAEK